VTVIVQRPAEGRILDFLSEVSRLSDRGQPDLEAIGPMLAELASETSHFEPVIADMPGDGLAVVALPASDIEQRLIVVRRPRGGMSAIHSHRTWVVAAPIAGVETHRVYTVGAHRPKGHVDLALSEERRLRGGSGDHVSLVPPNDVHAHGHVAGTGDPAFMLVLSGDDQYRHERAEYDADAGTYRLLAPGDMGTLVVDAGGS
jgi:predicted metal-dependent enzyme (double-stranded beta helix superfamily)